MAQNSDIPITKFGKTDEEVNNINIYLFIFLMILTGLMVIGSGNLLKTTWYIYGIKTFILLSSIIPLSLKVNVELAKLFYSM